MKPASILFALLLSACTTINANECDEGIDIEGVYNCSGECIVTDITGRNLVQVSGEVDSIALWPGSKQGLYQVDITGGDDFREVEIGALVGKKMVTATAKVSDNQYPVLEEYTFDVDKSCKAKSYYKTVLNPSPGAFKSCNILCEKSAK
jgi:ABC-type Fe3+-hydroxamate transport system substrate-binding protein